MAKCGSCGADNPDGSVVCVSCGVAMLPVGTAPGGFQPMPHAAPYNYQQDVETNKVFAILAYFGILVLIPIFAAKDSRFARYHANQGLILLIATLAYSIIYWILLAILTGIILSSMSGFGLYTLLSTILGLVYLVFVVLAIIGIINAAKGEEKPLPVIGGFTILK